MKYIPSAYKNFFEQHTGYPRFKSKHVNKQSCGFELGTIPKRNDYTKYLQRNHDNIKQATLIKLPCGNYVDFADKSLKYKFKTLFLRKTSKNMILNDRQWVCPQCGEVIERDYNAALNIFDEGLRIIGCSTS